MTPRGAPARAALLCAALLLAACSKAPSLAPLAPDAVIVAFGDSLTFGTGAAEGESYPAQLGRMIGRRIVDASVPGEVSAAGLERLPAVLDEYQPQLLLLCEGGNDFLRQIGKRQAADHVRAMVRLAKTRGIDVLLIGTPQPGLTVTPPEFYAEIAKEFRIPYEGKVIGRILRDEALKSDPIHPNAAGYRLMAGSVAALLKKSGALGR
ncbi:MAG: GDSL-type esterase/lipase family protein [Betaproteobacteria bacterium]|nr:GDSL-type esterase/lipase family protein [Betaproteobacteria bacterium]